MDTLTDYIKWLGHETFEQRTFDESDNLVFSQLAYYDFKTVLHEGEARTLAECYDGLKKENINVCIVGGEEENKLYQEFLHTAAEARRYRDVIISDYIDILDDSIQFAAMTFHISTNECYVAYRGTDDTIIGWKENFMLSFMETPAQRRALQYLKNAVLKQQACIYVGGHSKGGNLALYAAAGLTEQEQSAIVHLYINDGPGLCDTVMDTSVIDRLKHKTTRILPEYCVIGKLFEPDIPDTRILKSDTNGIMQHILLYWGIDYGKLLTVSDHTPESNWIVETLDTWLKNIPNDERQAFVEHLFSALAVGGSVTLADIADKGVGGFEQVLLSLIDKDADVLRTAARIPESAIFGSAGETVRNNTVVQRVIQSRLVQGLAVIAAGVMFQVMPRDNMMVAFLVVMTGIILATAGRTILHLHRSHWNLYQERTLVYITIIFIVIYLLVIIKEHALSLFSSIFFGINCLVISYNCAMILKEKKKNIAFPWVKVRYMIEMVLFAVLGFFVLAAPESATVIYSVNMGIILILDGVSRIVEYVQIAVN